MARQELQAMLEEEELKDAILLVFAKKQDQAGALGAQGVSSRVKVAVGVGSKFGFGCECMPTLTPPLRREHFIYPC